MPPYASHQDMIDRFGEQELIERTDRVEPFTGAIVDPVLDVALADATEIVDGYVRSRYALPLPAPLPGILVPITCALVRRQLYEDEAPEAVLDGHKLAMDQLRDITAGRIVLQVAGTPAAAEPDRAEVTGPERTFSRESLRGM